MTAPGRVHSDGRVWLHPTWIALVVAIGIAVLGAIGIGVGPEDSGSRWGLDNELTVPAFFSAGLLIGGGLGAALAAGRRLCGLYLPWLALALLLLAMGVDEVAQAHERLEQRTGLDWQILYAPVALAGGVAWLLIARRVHSAPRIMLIAGAVAWVAAQILENLQWDGDERMAAFEPMMITEELLEMTGSALFLLAIYTALRRVMAARRTAERAPGHARVRPGQRGSALTGGDVPQNP